MKWALFLMLPLLVGCPARIVRDRNSYLAEVTFIDRLLRDGASRTREGSMGACRCADGVWSSAIPTVTDASCRGYAEWWAVYVSRWPWHREMMLFNAGITSTRPAAAPAIPAVTCSLPSISEAGH